MKWTKNSEKYRQALRKIENLERENFRLQTLFGNEGEKLLSLLAQTEKATEECNKRIHEFEEKNSVSRTRVSAHIGGAVLHGYMEHEVPTDPKFIKLNFPDLSVSYEIIPFKINRGK